MTIETKFNIGDKVFFKKNNIIEESEVIGLTIYILLIQFGFNIVLKIIYLDYSLSKNYLEVRKN